MGQVELSQFGVNLKLVLHRQKRPLTDVRHGPRLFKPPAVRSTASRHMQSFRLRLSPGLSRRSRRP